MLGRLVAPMRRAFPDSGLAYTLFDSAAYAAGLALFWYITTEPARSVNTILSDTLSLMLDPRGWGYGILFASLISIVLAYGRRRSLFAGYLVLSLACGSWSIALAVSGAWALAKGVAYEDVGKAFGYALAYAWVTRRLLAAVMAYSDAQGDDRGSS